MGVPCLVRPRDGVSLLSMKVLLQTERHRTEIIKLFLPQLS